MTTETIIQTLLPSALALIMFSLGVTLSREDFKRFLQSPKAVLTGLFVQIILIPGFAYLLTRIFNLDPELSVGLMLLAASPGGVSANLFSHFSGGDVALNITLTAINSVLAAFTIPAIVYLSLNHFMRQNQFIGFQFGKMIEVFLIVLIPVLIGMVVNEKFPRFKDRIEKPFNVFAITFLVLVVIVAIKKEYTLISQSFVEIGLLTLIFNLGSLGLGYAAGKALKLTEAQAIGIGFEIGIHNVTLGLFLAYSILGNTRFAIPGACYAVMMYIVAGIVTLLLRMRKRPALTPAEAPVRRA
jgi:BASS family bile acid:Na+ symporter